MKITGAQAERLLSSLREMVSEFSGYEFDSGASTYSKAVIKRAKDVIKQIEGSGRAPAEFKKEVR